MQFQADMLQKHVLRPECIETTALGAAYLAGLAVGFWKDKDDIRSNWALERTFAPVMEPKDRDRRLKGWKKAVRAALYFANEVSCYGKNLLYYGKKRLRKRYDLPEIDGR